MKQYLLSKVVVALSHGLRAQYLLEEKDSNRSLCNQLPKKQNHYPFPLAEQLWIFQLQEDLTTKPFYLDFGVESCKGRMEPHLVHDSQLTSSGLHHFKFLRLHSRLGLEFTLNLRVQTSF